MQLFIFILVISATLQFPVQATPLTRAELPNNSFFSPIQQDSTPPTAQQGVVKIKNLENPKKRKRTPKVKKTNVKQVVITPPKSTTTVDKESTPNLKKTPQKKPKPKKVATTTPVKTAPPTKAPKGQGLSTEEEIKLLSRTKSIDAENKVHPESTKNCQFAFDVIDEFTGVQKRGLDSRLFFAYTPDEYRKFIKKNDFIRCEGFLSQSSEGSMALNINLSIASREGKQKFGPIKANSAMVLRTMEGKEYYLMTYPGAAPQVIDNQTHYQCSFAINKSDLKHLKKAEIDQVKISFQKGFQTYDVFYLDFLIDQFPCFKE